MKLVLLYLIMVPTIAYATLLDSLFGPKRDLLYSCIGTMTTNSKPYDKKSSATNYNVPTSLYIGDKYVESEGTKYEICTDTKTIIKFSDNCKNPKRRSTFDLGIQNLSEYWDSKIGSDLTFSYIGTCTQVRNSK
jgi:hypothetical protein